MSRRSDERGMAAMTLLVLAVAGIYLAFRGWVTVHTVLAPPTLSSESGLGNPAALVDEARRRDLALAGVGTPDRNPFSAVRARSRTVVSHPAPPPAPVLPALRMILYDQLSPEVQISVGEDLSGRLKLGQTFRGWTVVSISARSCVVRKDDETVTLSPRR